MSGKQITYIVHNINDAAVARRVEMFNASGARTTILGFRRDAGIPASVAGAPVIDLGRTHDSKLAQRAWMVLVNMLRPRRILDAAEGADIIIGRNLESLALAWRARRVNRAARLVYECLDIHRSLVGTSVASRAVRRVESLLLRRIDLLVVSAPAFLREYFDRRKALCAPGLLVENKLLMVDRSLPELTGPPHGPPWTIGWFGNLRCKRTLEILAELAQRLDGKLEILIAGKASPAEFPDFTAQIAASPHCRYLGPFRAEDLPYLYNLCHFAWAIDFFEEGLNSRWLLPNRLYEAGACGVVPIALQQVETGHWLEMRGAGLLIAEGASIAQQLGEFFQGLNQQGYDSLREAVRAIASSDLIADRSSCDDLMTALAGARSL